MQHFADFGYVRQANKQLKRMYETKIDPISAKNLGELSAKKYPPDKEYFDSMLTRGRYTRKQDTSKVDPLTNPAKPSALVVGDKTNNEWSEIRTTEDKAASPTTYLGYRKDPYKGYGGMMEEAIPSQDLNKRYRSRLTGNWANE